MVRQSRHLAVLTAAVLLAACGGDGDKDAPVAEKPEKPEQRAKPEPPKPDLKDKLAHHRAAYAHLQETYAKRRYRDGSRKELLDYLADGYRKDRGRDGTIDEQLAWLDEVYEGSKQPQDLSGPDPDAVYAIDISGPLGAGQVEGPADAPVTIVLAFDYACPHCDKVRPIVHELVASYAGQVRAVYMHMVVHPVLVDEAHRFACGAAKQGKFLAYHDAIHDKLYASYVGTRDHKVYDTAHLIELGTSLGLDPRALARDGADPACARRVRDDQTELRKFEVAGTPTFYINGKIINGSVPRATLVAAIDRELKIASASGIPAGEYYQRAVFERGDRSVKPRKRAPTLP